MNLVKDILSHKTRVLVSVKPDSTVLDALKVMAENNIGSVVVLDQQEFKGVFTERDYSRKIILRGKSSGDTTVSEVMTTELPKVKPDDSIELCMHLMNDSNIRYLPVFDGTELKGIISISDVIKETVLVQQQTIQHLDSYIRS